MEQDEDFDPDLFTLTQGGIGCMVSVKEEEEGLLERG